MRWPITPEERFWRNIDKTDTCWIWTARKTPLGYGRIYFYGKTQYAHRISYVMARGEIPTGTEIDHLCRNPSCVNPEHLEAVAHRTNALRGNGWHGRAHRGDLTPAMKASRTGHAATCKRGHARTAKNVHIDKRGQWKCRVCERERGRRRYARQVVTS